MNGRGDPLRWPRDTLYPLKLALTWPTSGGRSVGIVRLRTGATEFVLYPNICTGLQVKCQPWLQNAILSHVKSYTDWDYNAVDTMDC
jgi:hypothetical protein